MKRLSMISQHFGTFQEKGHNGAAGYEDMKRIVLASASPRRRELLAQIGLSFEVDEAAGAEEVECGLEPSLAAIKIARGKAREVARRHRGALVIAADTMVVLGGSIFGKPHSAGQARAMLRRLNGRTHTVITGFTVLDARAGRELSRAVETRVTFRKLAPAEIESYVTTGEPLDKAGGYAIQGLGAVLVDRIEGEYSNVVGLPLAALAESLSEFGVDVLGQSGLPSAARADSSPAT